MRVIEDRLKYVYHDEKEHVINLFLALQKQNFVLGNSLTNVINHWPNEEIIFVKPSEGVQKEIRNQK